MDDATRFSRKGIDHICAERLKPNLVWLTKHLQSRSELTVTKELETQLQRISVSTVRRIQQVSWSRDSQANQRCCGITPTHAADVPRCTGSGMVYLNSHWLYPPVAKT